MKKFLVVLILFGSIVCYSFFVKENTSIAITTPVTSVSKQQSTQLMGTQTPSAATTPYKDGTYKGDSIDAYYGIIKVQATIHDGRLADVTVLSYPDGHRESVQINENALPILKEEAISVQSANVDGVSRATFTSDAFKQSLASALSQAK